MTDETVEELERHGDELIGIEDDGETADEAVVASDDAVAASEETEETEETEASVDTDEAPTLDAADPDAAELEAGEPAEVVDPDRKWYVIHTYSGYENKVKANLERRIKSMAMQDFVYRVLVPMDKEVEFKDGKRREVEKKVYPGYVLVEMKMTDASWYVVRNTQGVTGFVGSPGSGEKPLPLADKEVKTILKQMGIETPKLKIDFSRGDRVKVTSGPFFDFTGTVDEIDPQKEKLRALISIFGRETPVELEFYQVEKV